jgi:hypothetical protein
MGFGVDIVEMTCLLNLRADPTLTHHIRTLVPWHGSPGFLWRITGMTPGLAKFANRSNTHMIYEHWFFDISPTKMYCNLIAKDFVKLVRNLGLNDQHLLTVLSLDL